MSTPAREALDHRAIPWLFATAMVTIAPHFEHQPLWLSLFSSLILLWGGWLWWRNQRLPNRWLLILIVVLASAGIHYEFRTLLGRDAGVSMLVVFMAMKLLELKRRRDGVVVINLGYFLLLTHYFYSQSIFTGLWLLIALWIVSAALIRLHGGPASSLRSSLRYAALLGAQAIPFMVVLYLLFPRVGGPLWGLPQDAHAGKTGLSSNMTPGNIAELAQSSEIAFRVRFDGAPPPRGKLYWRGPVLENFDGRTWQPADGIRNTEKLDFLSPAIGYETTLEAHNQRWLLALDAPRSLPPETSLNGRLTANSKTPLTSRERYRLSASLDYRLNIQEDEAVLRTNLRQPKGFNPKTQALGEAWRKDEKSPEAIIKKALALFGTEFYYTLRPPLLGTHAVDEFLFTTRRGFCEHYSAAFVTLMRSAGVPARVVTGYQGGELNPLDGYVVVRQYDAHAWAEVWIEGRGWLRIDPTAAVSPNRIETGIGNALGAGEPLPMMVQAHGEWLRSLRYRWEAINNAWNQQIIGYDLQRQRELLSRLGFPDSDWQSLGQALIIAIVLLLVATLGWAFHQQPRHDPLSRLWHKALAHLARHGVNCAPWETPLDIAQRVRQQHPGLADAFDDVVEAYLMARYGLNGNLQFLREAVARLP